MEKLGLVPPKNGVKQWAWQSHAMIALHSQSHSSHCSSQTLTAQGIWELCDWGTWFLLQDMPLCCPLQYTTLE